MTYPEEEFVKFIRWFIRHKRSEVGILPPNYIINTAKKYKWIYTGYAYRGFQIYTYTIKGKLISKKKLGSNIRYKPRKL